MISLDPREQNIKEIVTKVRSLQKASEVLGISKFTLYSLYRRRGWLMPPSDAKTGKWDMCLAKEMRGRGWSDSEIGKEFGISGKTVGDKLREQGIHCSMGIPKKIRERHELRKKGLTLQQIADRYGVTRQAIEAGLSYWYGGSTKDLILKVEE